MKKIVKKILGIILIVLGLFALFTPFSPGSWLALIGLEILGIRVLLERKFISFLPQKYRKKINNKIQKFENRIPFKRKNSSVTDKDNNSA